MAGVRPPAKDIDGVSITPVLKGARALKREALYWHYPHYSNQGGVPAGSIRRGRYKLIEFYEDNRLELFDLAEDPGERKNLARTLPKVAAELHGLLRNWRRSVKATMPAVNPSYDASQADQGLTGAEPKMDPI
jgi:arylsulfatase A-like enzyme